MKERGINKRELRSDLWTAGRKESLTRVYVLLYDGDNVCCLFIMFICNARLDKVFFFFFFFFFCHHNWIWSGSANIFWQRFCFSKGLKMKNRCYFMSKLFWRGIMCKECFCTKTNKYILLMFQGFLYNRCRVSCTFDIDCMIV